MRLIGITPAWQEETGKITVNRDYMDAVSRAGALPVVLPLTEDEGAWDAAVRQMDGLLFSGGGDLSPHLYGEETLPCCGEICPRRDRMEWGLLRLALERDMPVLGICRGAQLLNCLLGGTLYQDIASQRGEDIGHARSDVPREAVHAVTVKKNSPLYRITGKTELWVNSRHHQGVKTLGRGLRACAAAPDGLIEGLFLPDSRFVLAVQWHPESMSNRMDEQQAIFNAFAEACEG